jgi:hypothetical protein
MGQGDLMVIRSYVERADSRLVTIKGNLKSDSWVVPVDLPKSVEASLRAFATTLDQRALLEESADDPVAREKMIAERNNLADQEKLTVICKDVCDKIGRYERIAALELSKKDTATAQITAQSTTLTKALITDTFRKRFLNEIRSLMLTTLEVTLAETEGKKGEKKFGLRLSKAIGTKVRDVASEGEQRCVALGAFLAELSLAAHDSALVFDDPVSSLDHSYRERTANRLAIESSRRQVIVFTHDAVFLNDLMAFASQHHVPTECRHLEWLGSSPGLCQDGLPWDCKSPEDRLDRLEKEQGQIATKWSMQPNEDDIQSMRHAYSWLRATLERIVEKVVFADVVFRYRTYVNLKNLSQVVGFQESECSELERLFRRCCDVTEAHDSSSGKQPKIPHPDELKEDIDATKRVLSDIRLRRKKPKGS